MVKGRLIATLLISALALAAGASGASAGSCDRSPGGREAPEAAITIGDGPAYAVLGFERPPPSRRGVVHLGDDLRSGGYYVHKTLWAIRKNYQGPVTITGRSTDGSHQFLFLADDGGSMAGGQAPKRTTTLRIPSVGTNDWRYYPTATLIPGPGCYKLHVRTRRSADVLIFRAVL